jgi:hypothetical protein
MKRKKGPRCKVQGEEKGKDSRFKIMMAGNIIAVIVAAGRY